MELRGTDFRRAQHSPSPSINHEDERSPPQGLPRQRRRWLAPACILIAVFCAFSFGAYRPGMGFLQSLRRPISYPAVHFILALLGLAATYLAVVTSIPAQPARFSPRDLFCFAMSLLVLLSWPVLVHAWSRGLQSSTLLALFLGGAGEGLAVGILLIWAWFRPGRSVPLLLPATAMNFTGLGLYVWLIVLSAGR